MSDSSNNLTQLVTVQATSHFEDDDEALEALVQLKEIELGDVFTDRDTQLDADDGEGISIVFSHDEIYNHLHLQTDTESNVDLSLSLSNEHVDSSSSILNKILEKVGPITTESLILFKTFEMSFQSLNLPLDQDTELDVTGIKIRRDNTTYIIQEDDEGKVSVSTNRDVEQEIEDTFPDDIGSKEIKRASEFIEEFQ